MSMEAVQEFRERVNSDEALANEVRDMVNSGGDIGALAQRHGFDLTSAELQQGWGAVQEGELTPFELELVSGGNLRENKANSVHYT